MDFLERDLQQCLETIARALPQAVEHAKNRDWKWAATAAREVLRARITLDRDTSAGDLRRRVTDDQYEEAYLASDRANAILRESLAHGATELPNDKELLALTDTRPASD